VEDGDWVLMSGDETVVAEAERLPGGMIVTERDRPLASFVQCGRGSSGCQTLGIALGRHVYVAGARLGSSVI
jgi:hypothetical protein